MIDRVFETCQHFTQHLELGRLRDELARGLRSFPVGNYLIFYRVGDKVIEVVRELSGYRDLDALF